MWSPMAASRRRNRARKSHRTGPRNGASSSRMRAPRRSAALRQPMSPGSSPPFRTSRRPSRSPRIRRRRRAARCNSTTRSRTTTASSARRPASACSRARAPTASLRARCSTRPRSCLALPQARTRNGAGQTLKDLTEHPWAGTDVAMTLVARDEAANEGASEPFEFRLPERPFSKPMARALVEQRRVLALDADAQARVLTALDALTIAPERFNMESQRLSRTAFDLLAARARQVRRSVARRGRAHVGHGGATSRTATSPTPSRRCARPRKRFARRSIAAQATRRSRSSPTSCARRSTSSCRRWPSRCAKIRSSLRGRSIPIRGNCGRKISRA